MGSIHDTLLFTGLQNIKNSKLHALAVGIIRIVPMVYTEVSFGQSKIMIWIIE